MYTYMSNILVELKYVANDSVHIKYKPLTFGFLAWLSSLSVDPLPTPQTF